MGASDIGVGRHVKEMAKGFYGRIVAYEQGIAAGDEQLSGALRRNLYGTATPTPESIVAITRYVRRQVLALAAIPTGTMLTGNLSFGPLNIENE
jgi:cytochrome b pre-mRNA-processing protein 3